MLETPLGKRGKGPCRQMDLNDSANANARPSRTSGTVPSTKEVKTGVNEEAVEGAEGVRRFVAERVAPRLVGIWFRT